MKLHEIIKLNEDHETSLLIEALFPYKRSLLTYYKDYFCCDPVLMVTDVSNAAQYGKIVPSNEFKDAIYAYMGVDYVDEDKTDSEEFCEFETINFNSKLLKDLVTI